MQFKKKIAIPQKSFSITESNKVLPSAYFRIARRKEHW